MSRDEAAWTDADRKAEDHFNAELAKLKRKPSTDELTALLWGYWMGVEYARAEERKRCLEVAHTEAKQVPPGPFGKGACYVANKIAERIESGGKSNV